MAFVTHLNFVIGAILELLPQMDVNPPQLTMNGLGPVLVTHCGNGRWQNRSSYYFNCGVNQDANRPGPIDEKGQLTPWEGHNAAFWFETNYAGHKAKVLQNDYKWNFTLVRNSRAFNFHIEVR